MSILLGGGKDDLPVPLLEYLYTPVGWPTIKWPPLFVVTQQLAQMMVERPHLGTPGGEIPSFTSGPIGAQREPVAPVLPKPAIAETLEPAPTRPSTQKPWPTEVSWREQKAAPLNKCQLVSRESVHGAVLPELSKATKA
jgi:hypothetical protein